jgi:bifunctional non-homologous end joining protein LigD
MARLDEYRRKRRFDRTPEPPPEKPAARKAGERRFVVQKHAARRLHYDFRLEHDGVLLSWAVPKGPSLDPKVKRLAARTEDHPLEYLTFEGVIPKGEYGGGAVIVWDLGWWEPEGDPAAALEKGRLTFRLHGEKLRGRFHLIRTRGEEGKDWLLFKSKDEEARAGDGEIVSERPESVLSRRTIEEVRKDPDRVWHSKEVAGEGAPEMPDPSAIDGAVRAPLPPDVGPALATLADDPPAGDAWIHEIKLDGYRIMARLEGGRVRMLTRKALDWAHRMPSVARAVRALPVEGALLDGEVVVFDAHGRSDFQALQGSLAPGADAAVVYVVFDLLHLDGYDLRGVPTRERKELLRRFLLAAGVIEGRRIRYGDHVRGAGPAFYRNACELGLEGIVSKRADRPYRSGRSGEWLKVKCSEREEYVIGGFTDPGGSGRTGFGAILVGAHQDGQLIYHGKVGAGFSEKALRELHARFRAMEIEEAPFASPPRERGIHFIRPDLVAHVEHAGLTADGMLRQPRFLGLREDKPPGEVVLPRPGGRRKKRPARSGGGDEIRDVKLTNPERVLYPEQGITKRELAGYYDLVADRMLPHVRDRLLTLVRCPEGTGKKCFYQKHVIPGLHPSIREAPFREEDGTIGRYMAIDDATGLVALVQIGVLEVHVQGARASDAERPDLLVFDLDPDEGLPWERVVEAAVRTRDVLDALGLRSFLKTTGGKGLHVVVPVEPRLDWQETKAFTKSVAESIVRHEPDRYVATMSKAKRKGKVFVDYLRSSRGASAICVYSTRRRAGAPVSTPLSWDELGRIRSDYFSVRNLPARLRALRRDPWEGFFEVRQTITDAMRRSDALLP